MNKSGFVIKSHNQAITIAFFLRFEPYKMYKSMNVALFVAW